MLAIITKQRYFFIFSLVTSSLFCQVSIIPTSTIPCNSSFTSVNFTISSGVAPYSFTIQTPSCASTFTAISSTTNPSFTLSCAGVYTFTIKDVGNNLLGSLTHTCYTATNFNASINTASGADTLCDGMGLLLILTASTPNYTISPFAWSTGATITSVYVSPTTTTTYSITGTLTTPTTRTCNAIGYKTIVVKNCTGVNENICNSSYIQIYPNPIIDELNLEFTTETLGDLQFNVFNLLGQSVYAAVITDSNERIDLSGLPNGVYIAEVRQNNKSILSKKVIKE